MLIAWEVTRSCMLACKHCRAAAQGEPYEGELTTDECFGVLDNIVSFARPIIILTGGEPMLRPDIYDIASYATGAGLRVVMAPCGALIDDESAKKILASGIKHISISLDGATAASHDEFRGVNGAFAGSLAGIAAAKRAGLGFQINTTITQDNLDELPDILELAVGLGASAFNPFLLVPAGRGKELLGWEISPRQYEETLHWLAGMEARDDILIRVTCAPHYQRILRQLGLHKPGSHRAKGCMGGQAFAFISHRGIVQICGFLDVPAGNLRAENLDFHRIWDTSELFRQVRDLGSYHGRCGRCEFVRVCGGCRARAFAITGDYLGEEPFCLYQPKGKAKPTPDDPDEIDIIDKKILSKIQTDFPVARRPFDELGGDLGSDGSAVLERIERMRQTGVIRRIGAVFDSRSLGYVSTLVAAGIPPDRLAEVAQMVSDLPGVTHNYRREHEYNLWFTLTTDSTRRQREILDDLKTRTGIEEFFSLPAIAIYKIRVAFQLGGDERASSAGDAPPVPSQTAPSELTEDQKQLVRMLQESLPPAAQPFDELAEKLNWPAADVIRQINDWRSSGVIRRFGAVVDHHRLGFWANGMVVFRVRKDEIDDVGKQLAKWPEVSHCYRRPSLEGFDYNLFAMVHGHSRDEVHSIVAEMVRQVGHCEHDVLFSTTQYKKTSMKFFL